MPVPVIAAVNGVAAGAGANLALCCDLVVAARSASFIQAFAKIGLVPDCGGTWLLPRLVGRAQRSALAMLGDKLPRRGGRAHRPDLEVRRRRRLRRRGRARWPRGWPRCRRGRWWPPAPAIDASQDLDLAAALSHEAALQRELGGAHDYLEGVAAFLAKRAAGVHRPLSDGLACRSTRRSTATTPATTAEAVGRHMFAADRATRGLGMRDRRDRPRHGDAAR